MGLGGVPNVSREISGDDMASVDRDVAGDDQDALGVVLWEAVPSDLSVSKVVLETTQMVSSSWRAIRLQVAVLRRRPREHRHQERTP